MTLETKIKITEEDVKEKLNKIVSINSTQSLAEINEYIPKKEKYASKEQYAASKILYHIDFLIADFEDPGIYKEMISNEIFPEELKPLVHDHINKIYDMRAKNRNIVGPLISKFGKTPEERKIVDAAFEEEKKEKECLNSELKKYRAIYRKTFDKMSIPKKYWWDKK